MISLHPTMYFSLRSPYSWLAWHDLQVRYPKLLSRLELVPFWEPDKAYQTTLGRAGEAFLYSAMSKEKHLYILTDIKRLAARRGLVPQWPLDREPHWEVPHLAWVVAESKGMGRAFVERATHARWQRGLDICDPAVIGRIADELGLDSARLRAAHGDAAVRRTGLVHLRRCIQDGVFGVPFFCVGREKFWGIDRLPDFIAAVANAAPTANGGATAACGTPNRAVLDHAGGCG